MSTPPPPRCDPPAGNGTGLPAQDPASALHRFDPLVRDWFADAFVAPTSAQAGAWDAIGRGDHTLVVAPTGSGKTLAAFLSAIDDLVSRGSADRLPDGATADRTPARTTAAERCSVLYLSPLKALAVDVERNLRSPLTGVGAVAARRDRPHAGQRRAQVPFHVHREGLQRGQVQHRAALGRRRPRGRPVGRGAIR